VTSTEELVDMYSLSERVHRTYGLWAPDHTVDGIITLRPHDPSEHYQRVDISRFTPEPSLELASNLGRLGMGELAFQKLSAGFGEHGVIGKIFDRHRAQKSTLVTTLHLRDVLDTGMTHANLYVTSGGDSKLIEINDVVANPMMSQLDVVGMPAIQRLAASGSVDMALPAEGAVEHEMASDDVKYLSKFYGGHFSKRLREGVAIHWSLPGTRGKKIITKAGEQAMCVVRVPDSIANIARKRTAWVVPIPMDVRFGNCEVEVLRPRALDTVEDVHRMMEEMVEVASELSGEKIFYGMPEGAKKVEKEKPEKNV
jgi:hypothetical protein